MIRAGREAWLAVRAWRFGGGDWLEPFRIYNGLDRDLRPVGRPDVGPQRPRMPAYKYFMYGAGSYYAVQDENFKDSTRPPRSPRGQRPRKPRR